MVTTKFDIYMQPVYEQEKQDAYIAMNNLRKEFMEYLAQVERKFDEAMIQGYCPRANDAFLELKDAAEVYFEAGIDKLFKRNSEYNSHA